MSCRILVGDARTRLKDLPDQSVHCVVTSPPYWPLREYDTDTHDKGMIGMEPTFEEHLTNLVEVFAEVHRVLRDDGTLWLNYGDGYAGSGTSGQLNGTIQGQSRGGANKRRTPPVPGCQRKDLILKPLRVAEALRKSTGWILRRDIIWVKPNGMPDSALDRPSSSHEFVLLMSKDQSYFYDNEAVRVPAKWPGDDRKDRAKTNGQKTSPDDAPPEVNVLSPHLTDHRRDLETANLRDVWIITNKPYKGTHFATFPVDLAVRPVQAGTSEHGVCAECGAPWTRDVEHNGHSNKRRESPHPGHDTQTSGHNWRPTRSVPGTWSPGCTHTAARIPATVLDPFGGSGTVAVAADKLGRDSIIIEISPQYAQMSSDRIRPEGQMLPVVDIS